MTKARGQRTSPFPSFPRRRETRYTGSQEEAKEAGGVSELDASAAVLSCPGAYNFLLHIFTSLKCKRRFLKCPFYTHLLFLRLRCRLVRQEMPLRVGFHILRSIKKRVPELAEGTLKATVADAADASGSERYLPTWHYLLAESERFQESLVSSFKVV